MPAVARVLGLLCGLAAQMPLVAVDGARIVEPTPLVLARPDPARPRAWLVSNLVRDFLVHGNAVVYVTAVGPDLLPVSVVWLPAERVSVQQVSPAGPVGYWFDGVPLLPEHVVHFRRGADPHAVYRGVGVLEESWPTWTRLVTQDDAAGEALSTGSAVPSVAVISPNPDLTQGEADAAGKSWRKAYGGPTRVPAILPAGTEVKPLSWNPADREMTAARQLSLTDVANLFNMDGFFVGASSGSYQYKSAPEMYLSLIRQTLGPIVSPIEDELTVRLAPAGIDVRFDRAAIMSDTMAGTVGWTSAAVKAGIMTVDEAREFLGKSPIESPMEVAGDGR